MLAITIKKTSASFSNLLPPTSNLSFLVESRILFVGDKGKHANVLSPFNLKGRSKGFRPDSLACQMVSPFFRTGNLFSRPDLEASLMQWQGSAMVGGSNCICMRENCTAWGWFRQWVLISLVELIYSKFGSVARKSRIGFFRTVFRHTWGMSGAHGPQELP